MKLIYGVKDRPKPGQLILFALQQLLAILAATIAVPIQVNATTGSDMSISAALFGADMVRAHDTLAAVQAARMADAVRKYRR